MNLKQCFVLKYSNESISCVTCVQNEQLFATVAVSESFGYKFMAVNGNVRLQSTVSHLTIC